MTSVLIYGSGEWEQLGLGDDAPPEIKRPRIISLFVPPIVVKDIACGGMHTLVLTTQGRVYSWGCNDEGALGRSGPENEPKLVDSSLCDPMTNITAGDCHSIAYNTSTNLIYRWGLYRNSMTGKIGEKAEVPIKIEHDEMNKLKLKKVWSGAHHTLVLTSGRVYGWGDPETGKTGRMLRTRNKNTQSLLIEAIGLKRTQDIFWTNDSSFAIAKNKDGKEVVYAWGLNNWGQLGIGDRDNCSTPTEIKEFRDVSIKLISGGAQHSIALTHTGEVYSWGKNEEGQLGIGDTYTEYQKKKAEERVQIEADERKANEEVSQQIKEAEEKGDKATVRKLKASQKRSTKKFSMQKDAEDDVEGVLYFPVPQKVPDLSNIFFINSGSTYNYAIGKPIKTQTNADLSQDVSMKSATPPKGEKDLNNLNEEKIDTFKNPENKEGNNEESEKIEEIKVNEVNEAKDQTQNTLNVVYSWGIGNSYVLGTREEDTMYTPYKVSSDMYKNLNPVSVSWGTLHVVVKALDPNVKDEDLESDKIVHVEPSKIEEAIKQDTMLGKKRKISEIEHEDPPPKIAESKEVVNPVANNDEPVDMSQDLSPNDNKEEPEEEPKDIEEKMDELKVSDGGQILGEKRAKKEETEDKDVEMKHK